MRDENSAGSRLAAFRKSLGLSQREFSQRLGYSSGMAGILEAGSKLPSRSFLLKLSEVFGVNPSWLLEGRGPMLHEADKSFRANSTAPIIEPPDPGKPIGGHFVADGHDFALINRYDVSASAGPGQIVASEAVVERIAFSRAWLTDHGLSPDLCGLVKIDGTSMEPQIPDGALVLVKFATTYPLPDGVYLFRMEDELFVKRLNVLASHESGHPSRLLILSDNAREAPPPRLIEGEVLLQMRILGRIMTVIFDL